MSVKLESAATSRLMILTADAGRRGLPPCEYPAPTLGGYMADLLKYQLDDEAAVLPELEA